MVGSQADSCRFYSEATLPENRAAQTCYGHCGPIVKEVSDLTFTWGVYSGFVKLSSKGNRVDDSEDLRTPVRGQAVKLSAEMRSALLPTTLWGKFPFVVAERVIRRPQNTSSQSDSESECRVAVCVGVLRNSIFIP